MQLIFFRENKGLLEIIDNLIWRNRKNNEAVRTSAKGRVEKEFDLTGNVIIILLYNLEKSEAKS